MDFEQIPYISCIRLRRQAIIPPLMTNHRRAEMRYYRELAVTLEKHLLLRKLKRTNVDNAVSSSDGSIEKEATGIADSEVIFDVDDSYSATDDNITEPDASSRTRRDSYTLEAPSPVMLEYMKANEKYDELLIDMMDTSDSGTVVNGEIPISLPIEELSRGEVPVSTDKLTLRDLEGKCEPENSSKVWNLNDYSFGCDDIKQFIAMAKRTKAFSLPNTSHSTPICLPEMSASSFCLKTEYENLVKNKPAANSSKNNSLEDRVNSAEVHEVRTSLNDENLYMNDSLSKYAFVLDSNNTTNMSLELEICGRESMYSDCSSVSLSKFFNDMKVVESDESTALNNYLQMKEQLELKHRSELMKLLREQQKENNLLDQIIRASNTSSPKSNYAYSKDVVLKKYGAENDISPILRGSTPDSSTIQRHSKNFNCRRRICDEESRKTNGQNSDEISLISTEISVANKENIEDFEARVRAATKINAAVRGYFVRRLFKTYRVQVLLQTINDCLITAISLQKEGDLKPAELSLQNRVLQQSITAQNEILEIFALPIRKQLEVISTDRELRNRSLLRKTKTPLPLSEATQKTIERRKSLNSDSQIPKNVVRKRCKSTSSARSGSNGMHQNTVNTGKTRTKLSQNYSVSRCTRNSWR